MSQHPNSRLVRFYQSFRSLELHPVVWVFALAVLILSWLWLPLGGYDWRNDIGPAARSWWIEPLAEGLPMPPWTTMLLSPLGVIPNRAATALTNSISVIVLSLLVQKLGGPAWLSVPLLLTPSGYFLFRNGQTEWLIFAGLLMSGGFEAIILVIKPQVALGAIIPRLRKAKGRRLRFIAPLLGTCILSLIVWPFWPIRLAEFAPVLSAAEWNYSFWPWGIPVGLALLWYSWTKEEERWAIVASPLLFPYVNLPSYLAAMAALASRWPKWFLVVWALVWSIGLLMFLN